MNKLNRGLVAASIGVLGLALAHAGPAGAGGGLTRAEVRQDLQDARAMSTIAPAGEIGDTTEVLAAREAFNALQTEVLMARYAQAQRRASIHLTMDELIAQLQALDAEKGTVVATISGS